MSRILKASYVNIENNIVIDNTFYPTSDKEKQPIEEDTTNENLENETVDAKVSEQFEEELYNIKQKIIEEANQEANSIIEEAKAQAEIDAQNIKNQAQEEMTIKAEEIYKEAFDKAYKEGFQKAEEECESIKQEAQNILDSAKEERQATINNLEPEIINFILDTTQNILTTSFNFNPSIISLLIKKGLSSVKDLKNLKIFVSEKNYDFVEQNKQNILEIDTDKNNIEIIKDVSLKDTDCTIETEIGTIQCNIDEQLTAIKEALHYILN